MSQKHLFLANDSEINIINFRRPKGDQDVVEIIPKTGQFSNYKLRNNNKLHGFFENRESHDEHFLLMIIESSTHIIDFAKMTFLGGDDQVSDIVFH